MEIKYELFLSALRASLKDESVDWKEEISQEDWNNLFNISINHNVLPLIFEAVYSCKAAQNAPKYIFDKFRHKMIEHVAVQTIKTSEFIKMYSYLSKNNIKPLVVKGIVCRSLYKNPNYRISGDEDLLIKPQQFQACHDAMIKYGMKLQDPKKDIYSEYEVTYVKNESPIYIELHKYLFSKDSAVFDDMNRFFEGTYDECIEDTADGIHIMTMNPTDHLFYLICHSFKHFLHSGFGIRQVCDITLYANTYGAEIDWNKILYNCHEIRAEKFTAALFKIGERYLTFSPEKACYPTQLKEIEIDETMMLKDLLDSGIYGGSTMSRKHSSLITLNSVEADKLQKNMNIFNTLFPYANYMQGKYKYLRKFPFLLPMAWICRIFGYLAEKQIGIKNENRTSDSIKIALDRIELLRAYDIISK